MVSFEKIKNKLTIFTPQKRKRAVFVFFILFTLFFLHLSTSSASAQAKFTAGGVLKGIAVYGGILAVLAIILYFCHILVKIAAGLIEMMLKPELYNTFTKGEYANFVQTGWTLVRDVCNLFFLLALLFIAFCTILRIPKYHAKNTLLMLIIMSLLINFSKPIAIFIFDGSQLLMNFFLVKFSGQFSSLTTDATNLGDLISKTVGGAKWWDYFDATGYMLAIAAVWSYAIVLFCIAILLLIRLVAFWILVILSPLAFLFAIIPDFSSYSTKWWGALFRYSYVGPAMAFFLWLCFRLAEILKINVKNTGGLSYWNLVFHTETEINKLLPFFILMVFLYASLLMANQFGIALAGTVIGRGRRIMNWGARMILIKAPKWATVQTGIPGAVRQKIESIPRLKRWLTKEGRKEALEEREVGWAEKMGVAGAGETLRKKRVAETREKWKKEGKTTTDFEQFLDSPDDVKREAAARELVRQNRVDKFSTYKKVLEAMKGRYATADEAINSKDSEIMNIVNAVKKKRPDFVAAFEYDSATLRKGRSMDQVYTDVFGTLKPAEWGDAALDKLIPNIQFRKFANSHFGTNMPAAARLEMAKNLSAKHAAYFKNPARRWI